MPPESTVDELLSLWERNGGRHSPEELCANRPELLEEVRERIHRLKRAQSLVIDRTATYAREFSGAIPDPSPIPPSGRDLLNALEVSGTVDVPLKETVAGTAQEDPIWPRVPNYRILGSLGKGGMGVVW